MKVTAAFFSLTFTALVNIARLENIREEAQQFLTDVGSNFHERGADESELYHYVTLYADGKVMTEKFVAEIISICESLKLGGHHPWRLGCERVSDGRTLTDLRQLVYEYLEVQAGYALKKKGDVGTLFSHAPDWNDFYLSGKGEKITQVSASAIEKICLEIFQNLPMRSEFNTEAGFKKELRIIGCAQLSKAQTSNAGRA